MKISLGVVMGEQIWNDRSLPKKKDCTCSKIRKEVFICWAADEPGMKAGVRHIINCSGCCRRPNDRSFAHYAYFQCRLPEQSHFPHEWHVQPQQWTNTMSMLPQNRRKTCHSDPSPTIKEKTEKRMKIKVHALNEMQMKKESCWHLVTFLFHFYF